MLVTGSAGFIGSWVAEQLISEGHNVVGIDNLLGGKMENNPKGIDFVKGDMKNFELLDHVISSNNIELVYHIAAYAAEGQSFFSPIAIDDDIIIPMNNLLVSAVNHRVRKIIFTSSMSVYGGQIPPFDETMPRSPVDPYGVSKAYCETMLEIFNRIHGIDYVIIRPHNVYGERQNIADAYRNVLGIWMNRIMRGLPPIIYGDGKQIRAFSYIKDVTPPLVRAGTSDLTREIINIGSDEIVPIEDACTVVMEAMGISDTMNSIYAPERPGEVKFAYCTVQKSMDLLGYRTNTPFVRGVEEMAIWAKKTGPQTPTYTFPLEITTKAPEVWSKKQI